MKRFISFLFGLFLLALIGVFTFLYVDNSNIRQYQEDLLAQNWFEPTLLACAIVGLLIALGFVIFGLKPSHKRSGLYLKFNDGEIYMDKKSIEKVVLHTIERYDAIRQPTVKAKLYQKKKMSYIDISVDMLVAQTDNVQSLLTSLKEDIKTQTEHFSEMPVQDIKLNVLDQKSVKKRVL